MERDKWIAEGEERTPAGFGIYWRTVSNAEKKVRYVHRTRPAVPRPDKNFYVQARLAVWV